MHGRGTMLIDCMGVPCVFMVSSQTPDSSGGYNTTWVEGQPFTAVITRDSSMEARIAEAAGAVSVYTVTVPRSVHLPFHSVIKRLSDGKVFQITSDNTEKKTPNCTALDMAQSTAEEWRLPQ